MSATLDEEAADIMSAGRGPDHVNVPSGADANGHAHAGAGTLASAFTSAARAQRHQNLPMMLSIPHHHMFAGDLAGVATSPSAAGALGVPAFHHHHHQQRALNSHVSPPPPPPADAPGSDPSAAAAASMQMAVEIAAAAVQQRYPHHHHEHHHHIPAPHERHYDAEEVDESQLLNLEGDEPSDGEDPNALAVAAEVSNAQSSNGKEITSHELDEDQDEAEAEASGSNAEAGPSRYTFPHDLRDYSFDTQDDMNSEVHRLASKHGFKVTRANIRRAGKAAMGIGGGAKQNGLDSLTLGSTGAINVPSNPDAGTFNLNLPHNPYMPSPGPSSLAGPSSAGAGSADKVAEEVPLEDGKPFVRIVYYACVRGVKRKSAAAQDASNSGKGRSTGKASANAPGAECPWQLKAERSTVDSPWTLQLTRPNHNHPVSDCEIKRKPRLDRHDKARVWVLYFNHGARPRMIEQALESDEAQITTRQVEDFIYNWKAAAPAQQVQPAIKSREIVLKKLKSEARSSKERLDWTKEKALELQEGQSEYDHAMEILFAGDREKMLRMPPPGSNLSSRAGRNYKGNALFVPSQSTAQRSQSSPTSRSTSRGASQSAASGAASGSNVDKQRSMSETPMGTEQSAQTGSKRAAKAAGPSNAKRKKTGKQRLLADRKHMESALAELMAKEPDRAETIQRAISDAEAIFANTLRSHLQAAGVDDLGLLQKLPVPRRRRHGPIFLRCTADGEQLRRRRRSEPDPRPVRHRRCRSFCFQLERLLHCRRAAEHHRRGRHVRRLSSRPAFHVDGDV